MYNNEINEVMWLATWSYWPLTYLPLDKVATISQTQMHFREWKVLYLIKIALKFVPKGLIIRNPALV